LKTQDDDMIVMPDSPDAATLVTVTCWQSRTGELYLDKPGAEATARYKGSTHVVCDECGKPSRKPYTACEECRYKHKAEAFAKLPLEEWDGSTLLYSEAYDHYLHDEDDVEEFMRDHECSFDDLECVICEPCNAMQIDADLWNGDLPEEANNELPKEMQAAVDAFNEAIKGVVLSWKPTGIVATWTDAPTIEELLKGEDK
jgi:hypothetical protein